MPSATGCREWLDLEGFQRFDLERFQSGSTDDSVGPEAGREADFAAIARPIGGQ